MLWDVLGADTRPIMTCASPTGHPQAPVADTHRMELFVVDGASTTPATPVTLADAGLLERAHLQEWVIAHPSVLGPDLLIVTSEYDRWEGADGVTARDRLDVLALEASGRLVVVELKRGSDRDIHLQAITYAALVSRFDRTTLAEAHADWLTGRGTTTTAAAAATLLEDHLIDAWDDEVLLKPRVVLVAGSFPRAVTSTAVWLSEMGLDVRLVQVHSWKVGPVGDVRTVAGFTQVYPTPEVATFTLGPTRHRVQEAAERADERSRAASTVRRLVEDGRLPVGAPLTVDVGAARSAEREQLTAWLDEQPQRWQAKWTNDPVVAIRWGGDGNKWRPTPLVRHMLTSAGLPERPVRGPAWWLTEDGTDLASLADGPGRSGRDWSDLHALLDKIPAGRWTTYGDLAQMIGTHANPLGGHLGRCQDCRNAYRVLSADGRVAANFAWTNADAHGVPPRQLLEEEGVAFSSAGAAADGLRLTADELTHLAQAAVGSSGSDEESNR